MILRATVVPQSGRAASQIIRGLTPLPLSAIAPDITRIASTAARAQVDSQGQYSGQRYAPLSPAYARYKLAAVGQKPILVFSGRLRSQLNRPPDIVVHSPYRADIVFSALPPYAIRHQRGGARLPARQIVVVTPDMARQIAQVYAQAFIRSR